MVVLFGVLALVALAAIVYVLYLRWTAPKHFRERYALAYLGLALPMTMLAISTLGQDPPWVALINLGAEYLGLKVRVSSPVFAEKLVIAGFMAFVMYLLYRVFATWNGGESTRQHERAAMKEGESVLIDGLAELKRLVLLRPPFERHDPQGYQFAMNGGLRGAGSRGWKDMALKLVGLSRRDLRFDPDPETGWHDEARMWIGANRRTGKVVGLVCLADQAGFDVDAAARYLQRQAGNAEAGLLVACRTPLDLPSVAQGVPVEVLNEKDMLDGLVDFTDYFDHIRDRASVERLPDTSLTYCDVYVPTRLLDEEGKHCASEHLEEYVQSWLEEPYGRHLALLGE
jgi:hypothetical protein